MEMPQNESQQKSKKFIPMISDEAERKRGGAGRGDRKYFSRFRSSFRRIQKSRPLRKAAYTHDLYRTCQST